MAISGHRGSIRAAEHAPWHAFIVLTWSFGPGSALDRVALPSGWWLHHGSSVGNVDAPPLLVHRAMVRPAQGDQAGHPTASSRSSGRPPSPLKSGRPTFCSGLQSCSGGVDSGALRLTSLVRPAPSSDSARVHDHARCAPHRSRDLWRNKRWPLALCAVMDKAKTAIRRYR